MGAKILWPWSEMDDDEPPPIIGGPEVPDGCAGEVVKEQARGGILAEAGRLGA